MYYDKLFLTVVLWLLRFAYRRLRGDFLPPPPTWLQMEWWGAVLFRYPPGLRGKICKFLDTCIEATEFGLQCCGRW